MSNPFNKNCNFNVKQNIKFKIGTKDEYNKTQKELLKKELKNNYFEIDKRRIIDSEEKIKVWNKSKSHNLFDNKLFRIDMLENVCIKRDLLIKYKSDANKCFYYDYEHIISHSNGGRTTIENSAILNMTINRSKKNKELYKFNFLEVHGMCKLNGLSFKILLEKIENNLHKTCKLYNLYFYKSGKRWSIRDKKYNNEYEYNLLNHIKYNPNQNRQNLQKQQNILNNNIKKLKKQDPISCQLFENLYDNKDLIGIGVLCFSAGYLYKNNR